jgi:putative ABC transport system permease protein
MTSAKLALRNVRKSLRDYTIYFLTLTFGVCVFYIFNAIGSQESIMSVTQSQAAIFKELTNIMGGVSVFVSIILGFLILYANRFLIRRRKKEFGVYMLLGMDKNNISRVLIAETVFVGLLSLATGLGIGVILSQAMSVLTAKLMNVSITAFQFVFSPEALGKTILYFGLIFLFVLVFNTLTVSKQKLIDLLYASRKNEWFKTPRLALSIPALIASIACIVYAYHKALTSDMLRYLDGGVIALVIALTVAGTFLFFFSLSGIVMKLAPRNKNLYLKGLNMFVLRQIGSKINTTYVSMTMVCLMLFISICTLSSGLGLSTDISKMMKENAPFDATITAGVVSEEDGAEQANDYRGLNIVKALSNAGAPVDSLAKDYLITRYYSTDVKIPLAVKENNIVNNIEADSYILKLSDYNDLLKKEGKKPVALKKGEYAVNYSVTNRAFYEAMQNYLKENDGITVGGKKLDTNPGNFYNNTLEVLLNQDYNVTIVVADSLVKGLPVSRDVLNLNYPDGKPGDKSDDSAAKYDKICADAASSLREAAGGKGATVIFQTASVVREQSDSAVTIVSYLAIYLGIIFLITAAAVLAIGQLSEMSDNIGRYAMLRKIGTGEKMLHRSIFMQILIYFGAPMLLAIAHGVVGIMVISRFVSALDQGNIAGNSLFVAAALLVIYGGYFLATYHGSKGILQREGAQRLE